MHTGYRVFNHGNTGTTRLSNIKSITISCTITLDKVTLGKKNLGILYKFMAEGIKGKKKHTEKTHVFLMCMNRIDNSKFYPSLFLNQVPS